MDSVANPINLVSVYSECGDFMLQVPASLAHLDFNTLWLEHCERVTGWEKGVSPSVLVLSIEGLQL